MSVVTLSGDNSYLIEQEIELCTAKYLDQIGNSIDGIERIDALNVMPEAAAELVNRLSSPSLFATKKLVIIRDLSKNAELSDRLIDLLEKNDSEQFDLIIVDKNIDGRSRLFKTLKSKSEFKLLSEPDEYTLIKWACDYARDVGGEISSADSKYLIGRVGLNQQRLSSEIDKLITYQPTITKESIDLLVEPLIESTTFDMTDAAFSHKRASALRIYREQRMLMVDPAIIIGSLAWQLHLLMLVKSGGEGVNTDKLATEAGVNPYAVSKAKNLARDISRSELSAAIDKLLQIEIRRKSERGYNSDDALEYYLLSI